MGVKERWKNTSPIRASTDEAVADLLEALRQDARIIIVYLFGSRTTDASPPEADLDIAFYTTGDYTWEEYFKLYGTLTHALRSDRLDLLWLNNADSTVIFDVIRFGKTLYYSDADILNDFELKAKRRFYDYSLYLDKHTRMRKDGP